MDNQRGNKELHEINQYNDNAFPVGMYIVNRNQIIPRGRGFFDLHWHEELQFTLVTQGKVEMQVNGVNYVLESGQAIFINRNLLHITTDLTEDGMYVSFNFPEKILGFFAGSRMEQDNVRPYTNNYALPATVLASNVNWQNQILVILWELQELMLREKKKMWEYLISLKLVNIWYILIDNSGNKLQSHTKNYIMKQERIYTMLSYIHENIQKIFV